MANIKQFKTRYSATAFMRKLGVTKEYYNNFLSTEVIGGKPVFVVDVGDVETFLDLRKLDEQTGGNAAAGNYSKENDDGTIEPGEYYNEDGSLKQDEPEEQEQVEDEKPTKKTKLKEEQPKKTSGLGKTKLGQRLRERQEEGKVKVVREQRKRAKVSEVKNRKDLTTPQAKNIARQKTNAKENAPATVGILKQFPDLPQNSIRAMCFYLILEGLDDMQVFGAMKEVYGEEKSKGKSRYPQIYRKELIKAGQLNEKGKRIK